MINRVKVVIISETVMDGVGRHIVDIIRHLDIEKIELFVIHSKDRLDYRFYEVKDDFVDLVSFYEIPEMMREIHLKSDFRAFNKVYKILSEIKPDVVHCHSSKAGVVGRIAAKLVGASKIVYTPHAYAVQNIKLSMFKSMIYLNVERVLSRLFTDLTLNVSEGEKIFAIDNKIAIPSKMEVLYNCVPLPEGDQNLLDNIEGNSFLREFKEGMNKKFGFSEDELIIGTVARLYTQKNPFEFLEIAKLICQRYDKVSFAWIGEGEFLDSAKQWTIDNGLSNRIKFLGHQKGIEDFFMWFDIFMSCAIYEGLPYTLIEALSFGKPILASNVVGNNELVLNELNGFLYELSNIEDAANKLGNMISSEELRMSFSVKSRKFFESSFTLDKMMKRYHEIYLS